MRSGLIVSSYFVDPAANISDNARLGRGCQVWSHAVVGENAILGENVILGRGAYIGSDVQLGDKCKVQNSALIYGPARLGRGVFVGPGAILTNDQFPRAVTPVGNLKGRSDWDAVGVSVEDGASIGAGAICVAPLTIGKWSLIGAGSTVVRDVAPYSLVVGSPAKHVGWVGRAGKPLTKSGATYRCPETGELYREVDGQLLLEVKP